MSGTELSGIDTGIDIDRIVRMMNAQDFAFNYEEELTRSVYIGTKSELSPFGFESNSKGNAALFQADEDWHDALEVQINDLGYSLETCSDGDSLYAVEYA